jgi:hypothetical protein
MPLSRPLPTLLTRVAGLWEEAQNEDLFKQVTQIADGIGLTRSRLVQLGERIAHIGLPQPDWDSLVEACQDAGIPDLERTLARVVLLTIGRDSLERVAELPVVEDVKLRMYDQFRYVCEPDHMAEELINPSRFGFRVMCRFMRLERFPAGQFAWELSGFPRSYFTRMPWADVPKALDCIYHRAGGHAPFFESHTAIRRELPILTEEEERSSLRLMAESMRLQPRIRGYQAMSWLLSPNLGEASPHLAWLAELYREFTQAGAVWTNIGPAAPNTGFLIGDHRRRRLYDEGAWQPLTGLLIWARQDVLRWSDAQK